MNVVTNNKLPASWAQISQKQRNKRVLTDSIKWDGEKKTDSIEVPLTPGMGQVKVVIDNALCPSELTMKLEEHVRIDDDNATVSIGEGEDGVITITVDEPGAEGNDYSVMV